MCEATPLEPPLLRDDAGGHEILLRPWLGDARDVAVVLAASEDPEMRRFSSVGLVRGREAAQEWIASRQSHRRLDWALEHQGELVGRVGLHRLDDEDLVAELGYWLLPSHRGKGLVTQGVQRVMAFAFEDFGIGRLEIRHEPENLASCAVADRCGFLVEGTQRGVMLRHGSRLDLHLHARLVTD